MWVHSGIAYSLAVVELELWVSCLLGKCFTTELHPSSSMDIFTTSSVFPFSNCVLFYRFAIFLWKNEPKLASISLCSQWWPWLSEPPASASQVLGSQAWTPLTLCLVPGLCGASGRAQGFVPAMQALCQLNYIPSLSTFMNSNFTDHSLPSALYFGQSTTLFYE